MLQAFWSKDQAYTSPAIHGSLYQNAVHSIVFGIGARAQKLNARTPQEGEMERCREIRSIMGKSPGGEEELIDWRRLNSMISSLMEINEKMQIALVNIEEEEAQQWETLGKTTVIKFEQVAEDLTWQDLFPEWIDEEEQYAPPVCPTVPMPDISDLVIARLPCRKAEEQWSRDVVRLQVHLASATVAARSASKSGRGKKMPMLFLSSCRPMPDLFRCEDLVKRQDDAWLYAADVPKLALKLSLPVGSCQLAYQDY